MARFYGAFDKVYEKVFASPVFDADLCKQMQSSKVEVPVDVGSLAAWQSYLNNMSSSSVASCGSGFFGVKESAGVVSRLESIDSKFLF